MKNDIFTTKQQHGNHHHYHSFWTEKEEEEERNNDEIFINEIFQVSFIHSFIHYHHHRIHLSFVVNGSYSVQKNIQ